MIKDTLQNKDKYANLDKNIQLGLDYLNRTDFSKINNGRVDINSEIYVNIQSYNTKSTAHYEAHRKYLDIQYMIEGKENIGVIDLSKCTTVIPYDEGKDIEFLEGIDNFNKLSQGEFMILYPNDAHKPSISVNNTQPDFVRKAVVKVLFN